MNIFDNVIHNVPKQQGWVLWKDDCEAESLHLILDDKNITQLNECIRLKNLYISDLKEGQLEKMLAADLGLKLLYIYKSNVKDFKIIEKFETLEHIYLEWNSKVTKLWDVSENLNLEYLYINDFKNLRSIDWLKWVKSLKWLHLSWWIWNKMKLDNFNALSFLHNLDILELQNIWVNEHGLFPLKLLTQLKYLVLSNQFATKDFAMLSVFLKNTQCDMFTGLVAFEDDDIWIWNIMIVWSGKPFLTSWIDDKKIMKYQEQFRAFQDFFRE